MTRTGRIALKRQACKHSPESVVVALLMLFAVVCSLDLLFLE